MKVVKLDGEPVEAEITACRLAHEGRPLILVVMRDITTRPSPKPKLPESRERGTPGGDRLTFGTSNAVPDPAL